MVTDQSGGYVANAKVTITDVARGVSETLTTDSDGAYIAINLLPGSYTVHAEYKGFKAFERKNILLEVGKDVRVDAVLQAGSTNHQWYSSGRYKFYCRWRHQRRVLYGP